MQPEILIAIAVVVVLVVIALALIPAMRRRKESAALEEQFGPEYDRAVDRAGNKREAERELKRRQERREHLDIRPLPEEGRIRYLDAWRETQRQFVDSPGAAVRKAHVLVTEVMRERGYPMEDFEQRAADLSVDHADVMDNYRSADRIAGLNEDGRADTEDLRQAMVHYRALFDHLLGTAAGTDRQVR